MFGFVFQKMLNKKWMVISLLIGNLLMVAIAAASPMYAQAVLQRTLTQRLAAYQAEKATHPGAVSIAGTVSEANSKTMISHEKLEEFEENVWHLVDDLKVERLTNVTHYVLESVRVRFNAETSKDSFVSVGAYSDFEEHITITHGELYSKEVNDGVIDVIVNEKTFNESNLALGQLLYSQTLSFEKPEGDTAEDAEGEAEEAANLYRFRIAGIFKNNSNEDPYWKSSPTMWSQTYLMDMTLFNELFVKSETGRQTMAADWYSVLDYKDIRADQVDPMIETLEDYKRILTSYGCRTMNVSFRTILDNFVPEATKLNTTIMVLQAPILVMLAAFVFMVSRQMLEMEQNEIAIFKSRGAAKRQIILLYLTQSIMVAGLSFAGGVPLGVLICTMLGASNAFLEFVQRAALPIELSPTVWLYAGVASVFSICTMVIPVFKFAKVGIVDHKRQKNRKLKQPWWQLVFLDVVLIVVSLYTLKQYQGQEDFLAQQILDGKAMDPILYLSSSVFMLGAGLLVLRLLPLLIRVVFWLGKRWWPPSLYASFLRILRTKANQGFLVVFLVLTVAMGIFNTQTARTINANAEEQIRYNVGADVVLQEFWGRTEINEDGVMSGSYKEPDFGRYLQIKGVERLTKVLVAEKSKIVIDGRSMIENTTVMGIHTKEFGETAWFKDKLMAVHWYKYLNAISQNSRAVLVSSNLQEKYGYRIGDSITFNNADGKSFTGVIYGFVDYWPTFASVTRVQNRDGTYKDQDNYLVIAHLEQLQANWGLMPYQIWFNTKDSNAPIYEFVRNSGSQFTLFEDMSASIVEQKNDPIYQGTNGILTIGFIIVLVLCATGFLIYWILSIQSRTMQFGIFRAMGMSMREILSMLCNEQFFISGLSIASGVVIGSIGATLYVPLIQIAYSAADRVIPLEIISEGGDYLRVGIVIGLMIVICMVVLGFLISKIKISQALKLGED